MNKISTVVIAKNEENNISNCINSVKFCDEVILIDDFSDDKTCEMASKLGARVYKRKLNNDFASQRNFGISKTKHDWILFVDADEIITEKLAHEIVKNINNKINGFYIKRVDYWFGKKLTGGENGNIWLLRLARRSKGKWYRKVHEVWKVRGNIKKLSNVILHNPHPSVAEFITHINFHVAIHAEENRREGKRANILKIIFYPILKFTNNFIIRRGVIDMERGFVVAILMSFHSFLSWSTLFYEQENSE